MRMCIGLSSLQKEHAMLSFKLGGGGVLEEEHWLLLAYLAMHKNTQVKMKKKIWGCLQSYLRRQYRVILLPTFISSAL